MAGPISSRYEARASVGGGLGSACGTGLAASTRGARTPPRCHVLVASASGVHALGAA